MLDFTRYVIREDPRPYPDQRAKPLLHLHRALHARCLHKKHLPSSRPLHILRSARGRTRGGIRATHAPEKKGIGFLDLHPRRTSPPGGRFTPIIRRPARRSRPPRCPPKPLPDGPIHGPRSRDRGRRHVPLESKRPFGCRRARRGSRSPVARSGWTRIRLAVTARSLVKDNAWGAHPRPDDCGSGCGFSFRAAIPGIRKPV